MKKSEPAPPILHAEDLIDDRDIDDASSDRLDHERIAEQLVELVKAVQTPTNIALYGAWGAGKSGVANLIKSKLADERGVLFARFDAFKFAENPLRRNFISAVATELGVTEAYFHGDLYADKNTSKTTIPSESRRRIVGWFAAVTGALAVALIAVVGLLSLFRSGGWRQNVGDFFDGVVGNLPLIFPPAAILAVLLTLVGKNFTVERSVSKPDSLEEFEERFIKLVARSGADKLVVFVDELDRCSSKEVVATLDAIRTFLGVDRCVFIVAADQHVLEEALTEEARQATPADTVNPYYSTGSAYLDKVFQYQVSLPPLLPQSISNFAIETVTDRGGLWADIPVPYVVTVLIPSHVASPRRVKHLLNTFALTYRLAEDRFRAKTISEDPKESAAAIARLVCLRVEFPLFARDLTLDARLPEYVLALEADEDATFDVLVPDDTRLRALGYARGESSPARLLTKAIAPRESTTSRSPEPRDNGAASDDTARTPGQEVSTDDDTDGRPEANDQEEQRQSAATRSQHGLQLLNYLQRTRTVPGPSRDLIFLRNTGSLVGLPGETAFAIEQALDNDRADTVREQLNDVVAELRPRIVDFIAAKISSSAGIEAQNAARVLMALVGSNDLDVTSVADRVGDRIAALHGSGLQVLDETTLAGAWVVAVNGTLPSCAETRRTVLDLLEAHPAWDPLFMFAEPMAALTEDRELAEDLFARAVVSYDATNATGLLRRLDAEERHDLLGAAGSRIGQRLHEAIEAKAIAVKQATEADVQTAETPTTTEDVFDPAPVLEQLDALVSEWKPDTSHQVTADDDGDFEVDDDAGGSSRSPVLADSDAETGDVETNPDTAVTREAGDSRSAWLTLYALLCADANDALTVVNKHITEAGTTSDADIVTALLGAVTRIKVSLWPQWIAPIDTEALSAAHAPAVALAVRTLWAIAADTARRPAVEDATAAVDTLANLTTDDNSKVEVDVTPAITEALDTPVTDDATAEEHQHLIDQAQPFTAHGYANAQTIATRELTHLRDALVPSVAATPDGAFLGYLRHNGPVLVRTATAPDEDGNLPQPVTEAIAAAAVCPTLDPVAQISTSLAYIEQALLVAPNATVSLPGFDVITNLTQTQTTAASPAVTAWLHLIKLSKADTKTLLDLLIAHGALTDEVAAAFIDVRGRWEPDERAQFVTDYVAAPADDIPNDTILTAVGLVELDDTTLANMLVARYGSSTSNAAREATTNLWAQADIDDPDARLRLLNDILIPWLSLNTTPEGNHEAATKALDALRRLGAPVPPDVHDRLADTIHNATKGDNSLVKKAVETLNAIGYDDAKTKGIFKKELSVPTADDGDGAVNGNDDETGEDASEPDA